MRYHVLIGSLCFAAVSAQYYHMFTYNGVASGPGKKPESGEIKYTLKGDKNTYAVGLDKDIQYFAKGKVMAGDREAHLIYYVNKKQALFPTSQQNQVIVDFINQLSSSSWYSTVKKYYLVEDSWAAKKVFVGNLKLARDNPITTVDCNDWNIGIGCNIRADQDISLIIDNLVTKKGLGGKVFNPVTGLYINNSERLYIVVSGPGIGVEVGLYDPVKAGKGFCSFHSNYWSSADAHYFAYAFVPFPFMGSECLLNLGNPTFKQHGISMTPNQDLQLDSVIPFLAHEIIEAIVQPVPLHYRSWTDTKDFRFSVELMDMCQGYFPELIKDGSSAYNVQVGNRRFLLNPIFDHTGQKCSMGVPGSGQSSLTGPEGYCRWCLDYSLKSPSALASNGNADLRGLQHRLSVQSDGNLVLYNGHSGYNSVWNNGGWTPRPTSFYRLMMQNDGNLVQYNSNGGVVWSTETGGRPQGKYCLKVENDGNLKIFDSYCNAIWSRF